MSKKVWVGIILGALTLIIMAFAFNNREKEDRSGISPVKTSGIIGVATFVDHVVLNTIRDSLLIELQTLGYTKDNGWRVVVKSANGQSDQTATVADELLNLQPACIISISTPSTKPIFEKNGGRTPHVYSFVSFPSSIGITDDSKNTTGLADGVDFEGTYALIQELVPDLKRIAMVYSSEPNAVISKEEISRIAKIKNVEFIAQAVSREDEIVPAVQSLLSKDVQAFFIGADSTVVNQSAALIQAALNAKVPVFATDEGSIQQGALAGLSVNYSDFGSETAHVVDQVIKAGNADDIQDIGYKGKDLQINYNSARQLGIAFPMGIVSKISKAYGSK